MPREEISCIELYVINRLSKKTRSNQVGSNLTQEIAEDKESEPIASKKTRCEHPKQDHQD